MTMTRFHRTLLTLLLATFAFIAAPARADVDYSDVWYEGPTASGWGVTFSQNDNAIYTTFFVYDVNHKPTWFGGTMYRSTDGVYSGTLYVALAGDFFGNTPFNPALNSFQPAGTMSFTATDPGHGILSYSVGAAYSGSGALVARTVSIQRQTLVPINLSGSYLGAERYTLSGSGCGTAQTPQAYFDQFIVVQTPITGTFNSNLKIAFYDDTGAPVCSIQGSTTQYGKEIEMPTSASSCPTGGATTTARVYDARASSNGGLEFKWTSTIIPNCTLEGRINAVRTN